MYKMHTRKPFLDIIKSVILVWKLLCPSFDLPTNRQGSATSLAGG